VRNLRTWDDPPEQDEQEEQEEPQDRNMAAAPPDAAAIQLLIDAAVAQAVANYVQNLPAPANPVGAGQPVAPVYSISPAGDTNTPWDFNSAHGLKLHQVVTTAITPLFDGTEGKLAVFLWTIRARADCYGFRSILMVPDDDGVLRSLTKQAHCLKPANVKTKAVDYLRLQGRDGQAAEMVRTLIMRSITPEVVNKLDRRIKNFTVNVALPGAAEDLKQDGPCMLFDLITMVSVETITTVNTLTRRLTDLTPIMEEAGSDIEVFNTMVMVITDQLLARNAHVPLLVTALFTAYKTCADSSFADFAKRKENDYDEGALIVVDNDQIMALALEKYRAIVQKGTWMQTPTEDLKFIALRTELSTVQSELKQLKQNPVKTTTKAPGTKTKTTGKVNRNTGKYAWKGVAPKAGEPHEKTVDGKVYIHCPHHQGTEWVLKVNQQGVEHKTGCRMMADALRLGANPVARIAQVDDGDPIVAALANIAADDDEEI
jgi:hypothetical protein